VLAAALGDPKALPARPAPNALRELAVWRPVQSLVARLLQHLWRHITGRPAMDDFKPL
jgi:DNA-3-methyladenine glycosylase II